MNGLIPEIKEVLNDQLNNTRIHYVPLKSLVIEKYLKTATQKRLHYDKRKNRCYNARLIFKNQEANYYQK